MSRNLYEFFYNWYSFVQKRALYYCVLHGRFDINTLSPANQNFQDGCSFILNHILYLLLIVNNWYHIVSIKTESYGCSRRGTPKIIVNGTDYLEGSDGINLVSIEPGEDFTISFNNVYGLDSQVWIYRSIFFVEIIIISNIMS